MPVGSCNSSIFKWPMKKEIERDPKKWASKIQKRCPFLLRVGYFGSYVRDSYNAGSDLDVIVWWPPHQNHFLNVPATSTLPNFLFRWIFSFTPRRNSKTLSADLPGFKGRNDLDHSLISPTTGNLNNKSSPWGGILEGLSQVFSSLMQGLMFSTPPEETGRNIVNFTLKGHICWAAFFPVILMQFIPSKNSHRFTPYFRGNLAVPPLKYYFRNLDTKGEVSPRRMKCPDGPSPRNSENHDSCSISSLRIASARS